MPDTSPRLIRVIQHLAEHHQIGARELARRAGLDPTQASRLLRATDWRGLEAIESALAALCGEQTWDTTIRTLTAAGMAE